MLTMQGFTTLVAAASFDHVEVPLGHSFSLAVRCSMGWSCGMMVDAVITFTQDDPMRVPGC
jgi:hypothetical protein